MKKEKLNFPQSMSITKLKKNLTEQNISWKTSENYNKAIDYHKYNYTKILWIWTVFQGMGIIAIMVFIFYKNLNIALFLLPFSLLFPNIRRKDLNKKRQEKLTKEFKEAILSISTSLSAGYSAENACKETESEMLTMFGEGSLMVKELHRINCAVGLNLQLEELLDDFGKRSGVEDIRNFSEVFRIAKRSGGDLPSIIRQTVEAIEEKLRVKEEIVTMTTSVRYEGMVMNIIPPGIIIYMRMASPDFFLPLYETLFGRIFMSCCLVIYLGTIHLQNKIMEVDI